MPQIELKSVSFTYSGQKHQALSDISFSINQGDYITVCGLSGSGKSTLLRLFKSVLTPKGKLQGKILYNGVPLEDVPMENQVKNIGFVMQDPDNQIVTDKVWHELAFGLESIGTKQEEIRLKVAEMAGFFGISDWFYKSVTELSGGQKQLLNLASVMAMQPKILILDEPTSQLDPIAATDFLNTVKKINRELGTTIIITEHRLEDILYASDKVMVLENGKIAVYKNPKEVGKVLKDKTNPMFLAMPSPMQIFLGTGGKGEVPLTVRDGALWLKELYGEEQKYFESDNENKWDLKQWDVQAKEVWYRYKKDEKDVLKGLDLTVPKGCFYSVVGANGAGKSTMLKVLLGWIKPYRGQIKIKGKISMVPQNPKALFLKDNVSQELMDSTLLPKKDYADSIISLCGLEKLLDKHPFDLSGGEMQKLALAKVLLTNPDILLLDEPTKGLDNFFKSKLFEIIKEYKDSGHTVIMVSHDIEFCARYSDMVSMFFDGNIIATGTPRKFFGANAFYTTAANRMCRDVFPDAVINEEVISLCRKSY